MSFVSWPLYGYVLKAVKRDRVIQLMIIMMVLAASAASFMGNAATIEKAQYAIATAGTSLRTVAVLGLIIFISFFVRRCFESREIDYLLATPLTRYRMLFSMSLAFITVAAVLALLVTGVMFFLLSGKINEGIMVWGASVVVELTITAMIALFFSIVLKSATISALCSLGFYSLSRMIGIMIGIIQTKIETYSLFNEWMNLWVKFLAIFVPRFDLLSQSAWIVYGKADGLALWILPVQALVFCTLFFVCAAFDLRRSQF